jgi:HAD superfamily hydrolase (TIGR01509 family)
MHWIHDYQLFLFDFDGLLVNSEEIHFKAYQNMCAKYGFQLPWSFPRYCQAAHYSAEGLKEQIYEALPGLYEKEPHWDTLYAYKRQQVIELLDTGAIQLMPGVEVLLKELEKLNKKRCVVTHSPKALVDVVIKQHPTLKTIPHWITRENYTQPKPNPEGYLVAINTFAEPEDKIIGFEDTPRGIEALLQTKAKPVLIAAADYEGIPDQVEKHHSFESLISV